MVYYSTMAIQLQPDDPEPLFRQIVRQIVAAIRAGRLRPGDQLPSQRELAAQLVVNHLTVNRAYGEMERAGLVATQRGRGTFVTATALTRSADSDDVGADLARAARLARRAGLTTSAWRALCRRAWEGAEEEL